MADLEAEKASAAAAAIQEVHDGMLVGLGTGTTTAYAIRALARVASAGWHLSTVATSNATATLARSLGLKVQPFETISRVDLTIDGADEIDNDLRAIKGGGGALLKEKVVAAASNRVVIIVDSSKPVDRLGQGKLPIEVLPFAAAWVQRALRDVGANGTQRMGRDGRPTLTDQGNVLLDVHFEQWPDPDAAAHLLDQIPGVMEHGLFANEIDAAYVARGSSVTRLSRSRTENP